jgi:hypothetical protein
VSDELHGIVARHEEERRWPVAANQHLFTDPIPAADRFVAIDHNSPAFVQADEALDMLANAVRGSNDLFASADERLAVASEVTGLREAIRATAVRVAAVVSAIKENGVIAFLAREATTAAIRALATKAIELLWALISP